LRNTLFMVSKIKLRLAISVGEKSRVPFGTDGLMDAIAAKVNTIFQSWIFLKALNVALPFKYRQCETVIAMQ